MSIPDPTIDPVTGLPLLNPNTPIQQIPLGADVFPFADLKASAQPARGPIYGDDIIPTSSLTSAQHPTLANAQTVQTDGNHAMKVFQVNPSGGGTTPLNIKTYQTNGYAWTGSSSDVPAQVPAASYRYLYGWEIAVYWMTHGVGTGPPSSLSFSIRGDGFLPAFILANFPTIHSAATMNNPIASQSSVWLSTPWDMQAMMPGSTNYQFDAENQPASIWFGWQVVVYVGP